MVTSGTQLLPPPRLLAGLPVRTATALDHGVSAREIAGPLWQRLHHGVHVDSALDAEDPDLRIAAVVAILPVGAAITGWAALRILGARELDGRTGPGGRSMDPVTVSLGRPGVVRPRSGMRLDRTPLPDSDVIEVGGVPITTPVRSCVWLAMNSSVERSTALIDVAARAGVADVGEVRRRISTLRRRQGVVRARTVATLIDGRSKSVPESVLKVVWVLEAGLPHPLVNRLVVDRWGVILGEPDLLDVEAAMVGEYDGSTHRELEGHAADNAREERFENHNLVVVRATSLDLWPRRVELVQRLREGRRRGLARDRSRDRWGVCAER